jgi:hypothetical protein
MTQMTARTVTSEARSGLDRRDPASSAATRPPEPCRSRRLITCCLQGGGQVADADRTWLPSVSSGWLFPACQCAPVLAAVKQGALDGGCGPA